VLVLNAGDYTLRESITSMSVSDTDGIFHSVAITVDPVSRVSYHVDQGNQLLAFPKNSDKGLRTRSGSNPRRDIDDHLAHLSQPSLVSLVSSEIDPQPYGFIETIIERQFFHNSTDTCN
jgi:hypothetical protein